MAREDAAWLETQDPAVPDGHDQGALLRLHDHHAQPHAASTDPQRRRRSRCGPCRSSIGPTPADGRFACSASASTTCVDTVEPTADPLLPFENAETDDDVLALRRSARTLERELTRLRVLARANPRRPGLRAAFARAGTDAVPPAAVLRAPASPDAVRPLPRPRLRGARLLRPASTSITPDAASISWTTSPSTTSDSARSTGWAVHSSRLARERPLVAKRLRPRVLCVVSDRHVVHRQHRLGGCLHHVAAEDPHHALTIAFDAEQPLALARADQVDEAREPELPLVEASDRRCGGTASPDGCTSASAAGSARTERGGALRGCRPRASAPTAPPAAAPRVPAQGGTAAADGRLRPPGARSLSARRARCGPIRAASRAPRPRASARSRGSCRRRRFVPRTSSRAAAACS